MVTYLESGIDETVTVEKNPCYFAIRGVEGNVRVPRMQAVNFIGLNIYSVYTDDVRILEE